MNYWVWMVYVLVMCITTTPILSQDSGTVKVGAIFTFSTVNGKVSKIAMEAAEDDINADPTILGGWKLSLIMHDSNFSGFLDFIGALRFMEIDTVAIIGPQSSVMARVLSHITKELQTPLLSFTALDPTISPMQFPYFIQTAPNDLFMVTAIADVVRYYQWPEVIAIYNDEDQGRNGMNMLDDMLLEKGSKLSYKAAISVDITRNEVQQLLTKFLSMESCVVIVYTYTESGLLVFDVAQSLGMVREGYVWIATTWLSNVLDSNSLDAYNLSPFQGALTLRPHTPYSKRKRDFIMRWDHLSNGSVGLNPCGLYAYDTVWMIAHAVRLFLDQGNTISFSDQTKLNDLSRGTLNLKALSKFDGGEILRNNILRTNMNGLTGPIRFNPDRSVWHPSYDVINVVKGGSQLIGYWTNYSGLSVVSPETLYGNPPNRSSSNQHLSTVVWPGGGKVVPRGWVFPHNGMPFKIGVPNRVSYRDIVTTDNGTNAVQGYCIDIFLAARRLLPYELPYEFVPFGDGRKNPNYFELVNEIATGVFDAVVGDISIVRERTKIVDFTQPFTESGLVVVAPVRKQKSSVWAFFRPFSLSMWGITMLFFLIVGSIVWLLEHRTNDEFRGPPKKQFVTVLWFSFSTLFMAHRENVDSTLGRFVLIIWLFVSLIVNSSYTASLTSILTVEQLSSPITGIESLITGNVAIGYQVGSYAKNYLRDELNIAQSRLVPLGSPLEYARALSKGTVAAIVDEKRYVDIFLADHCKFSIQGSEFTKRGWGFAFRKDSPIAVDMSTAILRLSENGELQRLENKWLSRKPHCQVQSESSDQLELENFLGLFLVCGVACLLALMIYFCFTVHQFNRESPTEGVMNTGKCGMRRIRRFMSYADGKTDAWKMKLKRKRGENNDNGGGADTVSVVRTL
ncbi:Glutamate receptor 3.1 [Linum perenne]